MGVFFSGPDMSHPLKSIVILGGGTAGWMTAAALKHHYRNAGIVVTVIESSAIGTIGVGEATIPTIRRFYASLGLRDVDVIRATRATCKLGIQFNGWKTEGSRFIHPFGGFGHDYEGVGFQHYFAQYRGPMGLGDLDDFAMGSALAKAGKFALPAPGASNETFNLYDWALHFDAGLFAKFLMMFSVSQGVTAIDARLEETVLDPESGHIMALRLDNGQTVEGDLFIDCSGFQALLIEKALGVGYESWEEHLFCDSAIALQSARPSENGVDAPKPYTDVTARPAGWQWHIPLQHRSGNGHVFSSRFMGADEAEAILRGSLPGAAVGDSRLIRFTPGRRLKAWEKNCIAIGLSSGFLEPLESTSIALIQTGIEKIKELLPAAGLHPALIDEYNDMSRREMERTRDFIILHYTLSQRLEPFWQEAAAMTVPETLARKIELYQTRGHFVRYRWEMFHPASWLAIYAGFDVWPETLDPALTQVAPHVARDHLMRMRRQIIAAVSQAPAHQMFIDYSNRLAEASYA